MIRKVVLFLVLGLLAMNVLFLARSYRAEIPFEVLRPEFANEASTFLEVDGALLHVRDEGRGRPLVLLHGAGASLHTWDGWVEALRDDVRLIRFDLPGFGLTGPNEDDDYRIARYVQTLGALLDRLGLDEVDVAGNSLGGHIAWRFALEQPQRVRRLVLIDAAGYAERDADGTVLQTGQVSFLKRILRRVTPRALVETGLHDAYGDPTLVTPALIDRHYRLLLRAGNRDAMVARLNTPWEDREGDIPQITQPTLILWGREDVWIPLTMAERFLADLPNATLRVYDGIGHVPMEELPEQTAADTLPFLRDDSTPSDPASIPTAP